MNERDPTIDAAVDELIAGDESAAERITAASGAGRAAELLLIHGLLGQFAESERGRRDASLDAAFERIRAELAVEQPYRFPFRRIAPLAAAAVFLFGAIGFWWMLSADHRAIADLLACHADHGSRRYGISVLREDDALPKLEGTVDVDGRGRTVLRLPLPEGAPQRELLFGNAGDGWWLVEANGSIAFSPDRSVVERWIVAIAGDAPMPSVDDTLAKLKTDYSVNWSIDENDRNAVVFAANRRTANRRDAEFVEIRYSRGTSQIRQIRWEWRPAVGSVAKVREVRAELVDRFTPSAEWFDRNASRAE